MCSSSSYHCKVKSIEKTVDLCRIEERIETVYPDCSGLPPSHFVMILSNSLVNQFLFRRCVVGIVFYFCMYNVLSCQGFPVMNVQRISSMWMVQVPKRRIPMLLLAANYDEPENSQFGRQDYWNRFYKMESSFSWYAGWQDLQPFIQEFVKTSNHVLIPGVGNDGMLVDMYDAGYTQLTAMDYASEGISRCSDMLGDSKLKSHGRQEGVKLVVADARDLTGVFDNHSFDAIIEKGTLDAIFLSGGQNKTLARQNLNLAITELGRCLKPGGIWISVAAVVDAQIQTSFDLLPDWDCLVRRDDLFVTDDGYTSNNIDGSLLVWRKR